MTPLEIPSGVFVELEFNTHSLKGPLVGGGALFANDLLASSVPLNVVITAGSNLSVGATIVAVSKVVLSADYHATLASGDRRHLLALGLGF